jgi:dipeptidyl aminopeptidase/acylaminoacyl peptidase
MTNWIIGHTDRFRAAVSQRSISSWLSFSNTSDIGHTFTYNYWGTDIWKNSQLLWERSPLKYADRVKTPTLFIHSEEDYRCWLVEGLQMYYALRYFDVPSRIVIFKNENHELSRSGKPVNRIKRLDEITGWFDKYLK